MITAHVEKLEQTLPELKPLFPLHYQELALNKDKVPLQPNYGLYIQRDRAGEVFFVALRESGSLIGYFVGFIAPGLHYSTCLTLTMDILYVHPDKRKEGAGVILFDAVKAEAKRRGVQRVFVGEKVHSPIGPFFEAQGFELCERTYTLWMGD